MNDILDTTDVPDIAGLEWVGAPEAIAKLIEEYAAARLEFGSIEKDREGQYGHQRFRYSPLGTLTEATAKPLARHGIVVMQHITNSPNAGKHRLHTTIAGHGARIVAALDFAPQQAKEEGQYKGEWIKEYGKLCTYLCRYAYKTALVLDSEPDADDADDAQAPQKRREPPAPPERRAQRQEAPGRQEAPKAAKPEPKPEPKSEPEPKQTQLQVVPPPTKSDPLAEKLSTPVESGTPVPVPEPHVEPEADPPASQELQDEFLTVFRTAGMTKIQFGDWCLRTVGCPAAELRNSTSTMLKALQLLKQRGAA